MATLAAPAELEPGLEAATMRRVGRRLIPLLFCLYIVCFIDRTNVGVAALQMNVDAATRLRARVIKPATEIADVGRFAVLADPQGAVFAAFTPASPAQVNDPPKPGEFSWHELITTDAAAGLRFYQELFGWEKMDALDMGGPVGVYQLFGWGGKSMGGAYNKPKEMPAPPHWLPYVMVPDSRKAATAVAEAGGKIIAGPMEVPGGDLVAIGMDPQGAAFAVHSAAATTAKTKEPATAGKR